jgi:hypothetical protein
VAQYTQARARTVLRPTTAGMITADLLRAGPLAVMAVPAVPLLADALHSPPTAIAAAGAAGTLTALVVAVAWHVWRG